MAQRILVEKPLIPPLAYPAHGAIPSMSLQDTISHAYDFGSISVVKTSSLGADGSLVSAHCAKSSPIVVSPTANLPTIVASESSSLSGKVSSPMIKTVEMKNSIEPASPTVANSEKIGIAVTLGNYVAPSVSETTTTQDVVVYGDGFSSENRENVKKDATITEIEGATPSDEKIVQLGPLVYERKAAMIAVINDRRYGALKSLCEWKQVFNEYMSQKKILEAEERRVKQKKAREDFRIMLEDCKELSPSSRWWFVFHFKTISIFEHDECFKAVEQAKDRKDLFKDYVEELKKKEYIRDLESEEEEQRKLRMINDFTAYLAVSSNTSGSTAKDLFTDVMDELEKQTVCMMVDDVLVVVGDAVTCDCGMVVSTDTVASVVDGNGRGGDTSDSGGDGVRRMFGNELVGSRDRPIAVDGGSVGVRGVHGSIWYLDDKSKIKDAVRMAKIGLTSTWMLDDFKVAIAKYISSPQMSDTNLKILNDDDILDASIVSCMSTDILNADDILDAIVVSSAPTDIE
ncbi:hypothetical protein FXO37_03556 [Capsicum annuum]|nr:hypothetical protein FXO37_03556 [Capsicum annuum]